MEGMRRFKHGAAALAQYALANRAEVRCHLSDKQSGSLQSSPPIVVAWPGPAQQYAPSSHQPCLPRPQMWQLLSWQGRHPQAPVAVAQRPHYFCELDVPRSVRHLLRCVEVACRT